MSEVAAAAAGNASDDARPRHGSVRRVLRWGAWLCVLAVLGFTADFARRTWLDRQQKESADQTVVRSMGLIAPASKGLASHFTDSKSRLLADPPSSPDKFIDPPSLVLAHIVGTDADSPGILWAQFAAHLSKAVGRPVTDEPYENSPQEQARIQEGKVTLVALHAAEVPFLVNTYGFQPIAVVGDESGVDGHRMDLIVPAGSPIATPADLRGHVLACTTPSSVAGYRAAVTFLLAQQNLRPNVDYMIVWSLNMKSSIQGIAKRQFEAAAVTDDKLQSMLRKGQVSPSQYKTIYQSAPIPRTTIGWFYNLKPELASKLREAILSYKPTSAVAAADGADAEAGDAPPKSLYFIPIEYKKDFEFVRMIDDRFDPRMGSKPKASSKPEPTTKPAP